MMTLKLSLECDNCSCAATTLRVSSTQTLTGFPLCSVIVPVRRVMSVGGLSRSDIGGGNTTTVMGTSRVFRRSWVHGLDST